MALGFIIFGWPKKQKEYGPTIPQHCSNCDNEAYFFLYKERRWFSLFFIPFLPLGFADRYLLCGICQAGFEIEKEVWKRLKAFTKHTKAYDADKLAEADYFAEYQAVSADLWGAPEAELPAEETADPHERDVVDGSRAETPTDDADDRQPIE